MADAGISFSGLASGMDTGAIVDALVELAKRPIQLTQEKQSDYKNKVSLLGDLSGKVSGLRTKAAALDTESEFRSYAATSSDEDKLTAVASSSASPGNYELTIAKLAQAERSYSFTIADKTALNEVGTGTLTIDDGTTSVDIDIDETTDTLEAVASRINSRGLNVNASIIYDGSDYRLLVMGTETGSANGITFTETGTLATKLGMMDAGAQAQAADDAEVVMDGITFNAPTNQMSEVIPGVTIDLKSTTSGSDTVTIKVDTDVDAIESKVKDLIDAYNNIASFLHKQFQFDSEDPVTNTLLGDSAARAVQRQLQSVIASEVDALSEPYRALSRVGVTTEADGTLTYNGTVFRDALVDDPDGVMSLFTYSDGDDDTENDGLGVRLERLAERLIQAPDGIIATRQDSLNDSISAMDDRIAALQRNVDSYEENLKKQFTAMEQALSQIQSQSNYLAAQLGK